MSNTSNPGISRNEVAPNPVADNSTITAEQTKPFSQSDRDALEANVSKINDFVQNVQRSIHFSVAENSGRTIIEVYDKETDELIRTIPSEEVQRISEAIAEQLSEGLLLQTNI
ncbi:Flagellar P-ring protein FlgI [gamma proteobacterium IMCC2047]|nr:Flagellar P-ring protein FlgI [gamma proteobacterium IMCC2047]